MEMECLKNKYSETDVAAFPKIAILVMMGLPGSGKTTLCRTLPNILGGKSHLVHICYDQVVPFIEDWSVEERQGVWKKERAKVVLAAEALVCRIIDCYNLKVEEKFTSKQEHSQEKVKLTNYVDQKISPEESRLEDERNAILLSDEENSKVNGQTENTNGELQQVVKQITIRCREDVKDLNFVEIKEKELADEDIGHYSVFDSLNQSIGSIEAKIQEFNSSQGSKSHSKLIILCVDDNFYYRSMRKEWWNLAAKYELPFCIVTLHCEVNTCIKRVRERVDSNPQLHDVNVPNDVIKRMAERLELPNEVLYPWEKHSIILESESLKIPLDEMSRLTVPSLQQNIIDKSSWFTLSKIKQLLCDSLLDPAKPLNREVNSNCTVATPSLVHRVDLALRRFVGKSDASLKAQVNKKRKSILEGLRNGKLYIPNDIIVEECEDNKDGFEKYIATLIDFTN